MTSSRWSEIDSDVLSIVFQRLLPFPGQVGQCRLVCKGWQEAISYVQDVTVTLQHGMFSVTACRSSAQVRSSVRRRQ
jgi:hypothetical protein